MPIRNTLFFLSLFALRAAEIKGLVLDPSGKSIPGALVTVRSSNGAVAASGKTNESGAFEFPKLASGTFQLTITHDGFKAIQQDVEISGNQPASLKIPMEVSVIEQKIQVAAKSGLANSDPVYQQLRALPMKDSLTVDNLVIKRDIGIFTFKNGTITLSEPIEGRPVFAVFTGEGEFALNTILPFERKSIKNYTGKEEVTESFHEAEFVFTDKTGEELRSKTKPAPFDPKAQTRLDDFRKRIRKMEHANGVNVDAQILTNLLNPARTGHFSAYMKAKGCSDLRFSANPAGTRFVGIQAEEISLDCDALSDKAGPWLRSHFMEELTNQTASSYEDKRSVKPLHYKIETVIGKNDHLTATALITVAGVFEGDRVVEFDLLPSLRVSRVSLDGMDLTYIQQDKKQDGSFYVLLPEPIRKGKTYSILVEYSGDKVLSKAGGGAYYVSARTSWYPSVNSFLDQATYELTFKTPGKSKVVSVGKLDKEWKEDEYSASRWVSEVPLAVAGFNYGQFKAKFITDKDTGYQIEGYAVQEMPSYLKGAPGMESASPAALLDSTMVDALNTIRLGTVYFGALPYGRAAITQQPEGFFGQSWPSLIYMPTIAYLDSTQRYLLFGRINQRLTEFVEDVGPHEVAHQWWGHLVGWASYRDQWLSEGFAEYTAWMVRQISSKSPDPYLRILKKTRDDLMESNEFGQSVNDSGILWMGHRAAHPKNEEAHKLIYNKGAYVLHMLRMMMIDSKTGDDNFRIMMKDFVDSHRHRNASTESFLEVVDRHMKPNMNLGGNNSMLWFFRQWVFGQDVPKYKFTYDITAEGEKYLVTGHLTQSEVSSDFAMPVPIYVDFDGHMIRTGIVRIIGNSTVDLKFALPKRPKKLVINYFHDVLERK